MNTLKLIVSIMIGLLFSAGAVQPGYAASANSASDYKVKNGRDAYKKGDFKRAVEDFRKALMLDPTNEEAKACLIQLGAYEKVIEEKPSIQVGQLTQNVIESQERIALLTKERDELAGRFSQLESQRNNLEKLNQSKESELISLRSKLAKLQPPAEQTAAVSSAPEEITEQEAVLTFQQKEEQLKVLRQEFEKIADDSQHFEKEMLALMDSKENHLIILTGPNMAGKSTYIRQTAILIMMAQMGSYIPASSAHIGIVDKIFTRIGAHDDISRGQSTFMVEMNEMADILNNLTSRSLVILDEIGRGTSTYDGLSLAWALAEYLQGKETRTLFATHFHELTALADERTGVKNYNVAVKEWKEEIIFLHKIIPGSTDDSYGIYVAKLAGIPQTVIQRAKHILTQLELKNNLKENLRTQASEETQLKFFTPAPDPRMEEIKSALQSMDVNSLTPLAALNKLQELKKSIE